MSQIPKATDGAAYPEWRTFEEAVATVQKLLSPNAEVKHNELITDDQGGPRQFDVTIRGEWCGLPALGVVECKHRSRPVGKPDVEGFWAKANSVNANFKVIVSSNGFHKTALKSAKRYNVGAMSLLNGGSNLGFSIGGPCYARLHQWTHVYMILQFYGDQKFEGGFDLKQVCYNGQSIIDWFNKELSTTHLTYNDSDYLTCEVSFDNPILLSIGTESRMVDSLKFIARREIIKKTKFVTWSGEAYYDWHTEKLIWPNGGLLAPDFIVDNTPGGRLLKDWADYEGEIPEDEQPNFIRIVMNFYKPVIEQDAQVIDLLSL